MKKHSPNSNIIITTYPCIYLGVSTGQSGLGLCPTRNQPDDIEFPTRKLATNCKNQRVMSDQICLITSRIGRSRQRCRQRFLLVAICIFHRIFAGFVQNLLDLSKKTSNLHQICAKLTRSEQKKTKL